MSFWRKLNQIMQTINKCFDISYQIHGNNQFVMLNVKLYDLRLKKTLQGKSNNKNVAKAPTNVDFVPGNDVSVYIGKKSCFIKQPSLFHNITFS